MAMVINVIRDFPQEFEYRDDSFNVGQDDAL
jgi:hypothetical protein